MRRLLGLVLIVFSLAAIPASDDSHGLLRRRPKPAPKKPDPAPEPAVTDHIGGPTYDGRTIKCNLPISEHLRNKVGTDRYGLCVWASGDHAARWQYVPELIGLLDYMTKFKGGGWPERVDEVFKEIAPEVPYLQCTQFDEELFDLALKTGRMPAVTYGFSPRYGENIAHMVNAVFSDSKWIVFLDNNFPGNYEWVPRAEALRRIKLRMLDNNGGYDLKGGWFYLLLAPEPPPEPK